MNTYALILAGGGGTRFWPLSRQNSPKQLLNLSGKDIMINETLKRIEGDIKNENTYIITNSVQAEAMKPLLPASFIRDNIIIEPMKKNTAPCILLSLLHIESEREDGVVCIFPSDHYIEDEDEYKKVLRKAVDFAATEERLVTIGIKPTFPSTGYGYIKHQRTNELDGVFKVDEFVEKPDYEKALRFCQSGNYLWNSGVLIARVSYLIECYKRFLPRMHEKLSSAFTETECNKRSDIINRQYEGVQDISIDYGLLERSEDVYVIPGDFGWNDVGSWDVLGSIFETDKHGNTINADHIGLDTCNSIIYGREKLITTIGIEDMIVVDTQDVLLLCPRSRAQDVKKIVEEIRQQNRINLL